jgi:hypothetical protein
MTPELRAESIQRHVKTQAALVEFLQSDLDLSFTMLKTAAIERASDPIHYQAALERARKALATIRILSGRVEDPASWQAIHDRTDRLERELEPLSGDLLPDTAQP